MGRPWSSLSVGLAFWRGNDEGLPMSAAARIAGVSRATAYRWLGEDRQVLPSPFQSFAAMRPGSLSLREREEIGFQLAQGQGVRQIAGLLGRAPSTISREVARIRALVGTGANRSEGPLTTTAEVGRVSVTQTGGIDAHRPLRGRDAHAAARRNRMARKWAAQGHGDDLRPAGRDRRSRRSRSWGRRFHRRLHVDEISDRDSGLAHQQVPDAAAPAREPHCPDRVDRHDRCDEHTPGTAAPVGYLGPGREMAKHQEITMATGMSIYHVRMPPAKR